MKPQMHLLTFDPLLGEVAMITQGTSSALENTRDLQAQNHQSLSSWCDPGKRYHHPAVLQTCHLRPELARLILLLCAQLHFGCEPWAHQL